MGVARGRRLPHLSLILPRPVADRTRETGNAAHTTQVSCRTGRAIRRPAIDQLAALEAETPPTADLSTWEAVRAQFALDPAWMHFASFYIASHPAPARAMGVRKVAVAIHCPDDLATWPAFEGDAPMPEHARDNNRRTVLDYERSVREYLAAVAGRPSASAEALRRLAAEVVPGARVLEIGSGPGWDADALEALGVAVHRTDVTVAFCDLQVERGKRCDRLDLLSDPIDGRYGGAMMLCVLQHFDRAQLDEALRKLAGALGASGPLLLMYPEGEDEVWEHGAGGDYLVVRWAPAALDAHLARAGFTVAWEHTGEGRGGPWRTLLALRRPP